MVGWPLLLLDQQVQTGEEPTDRATSSSCNSQTSSSQRKLYVSLGLRKTFKLQNCLLNIDDNVIDIDLKVVVDLLPKTFLHAPLDGGFGVLETKWQGSVAEGTEVGDDVAS